MRYNTGSTISRVFPQVDYKDDACFAALGKRYDTMPKIYLVRHGRAAAGWGETADPGLDDKGRDQAASAADSLAAMSPMTIVSSPMARAQETAAPLARAWDCPLEIDPRFSEIPTPKHMPVNRKAWIRDILSKRWDAMGAELQAWRKDLLAAVGSLKTDTVIFSHFIAINAIAGEALGNSSLVVFLPDNASITTVRVEGPVITSLEKGAEMPTLVG